MLDLVTLQMNIMKWIVLVFLIAYAPRMLCWLAPLKKQKRLVNEKQNGFALIIPARNEGNAVLPLFDSILAQTYPMELFDTYVVVKEKNDPVREYAKRVDATVYVDETQTCKGDCLDYCIKAILRTRPEAYDGYIIVDADCALTPDFLLEMNNAMASGAQVINAKKLVKNYYTNEGKNSNLVTACNGLIWTLMDDMGNRFKSDHGYTTMTVSTGILIRSDLIQEWKGWIYNQTLTEDMELQRDCGVKGYQTFYYSYAQLYMEEAPTLAETNKRRRRWMTGLIGSDKIYCRQLLKKHMVSDIVNNYYLLCLWLSYAFIGSLYAIFMINLMFAGWGILTHSDAVSGAAAVALHAFLLIYLSFFIMTLTAMLVDRHYIKLTPLKWLAVLFVHPLFYMEYIRIVAKAIIGRAPGEWEEIKRVEVKV